MKLDARNLNSGEVIVSDVCIVGAGPAGITAAREFIGAGLQVSVLESGGDAHDFEVQRLSEGALSGHLYEPQESTHMRQIGGTANHYILRMTDNEFGYRYTPLDPIDFEQRDAIPHSGWPIKKTDLDPYYERVQRVCGIGHYEYSDAYWARDKFETIPLAEDKAYSSVFMFGPTKKFSKEFPAQIAESTNVNLYAYATVVELICGDDGTAVESALVRMFDGKEVYFKAKHFIIAANALQTPRLLLNSKRHHPQGIGNQHDNVGRYFMDHHLIPSGNFIMHDRKTMNKMGFYDMQGIDGCSVLGRINLSPTTMKKEGLRNFSAMLFPMPWNSHDLEAMNSFNHLKVQLRWHWDRWPKDFGFHLMNIFRGRNRLFRALYENVRYGVPFYVGLGRGGWSRIANNEKKYDRLELLALVEVTPNPNNRVTAIEEKDALGCPKTKVHYVCSEDDIASVKRAQQIMGEALTASGLGYYEPPKVPADVMKTLTGTHHMMGTTRMSEDPRHGVVDRDCCVHGVQNLFIAGSATFVTGGYANPTLTNLALSIRIADKVKALLAHA
jgi:choline dehydrogenase-like flavoprotein